MLQNSCARTCAEALFVAIKTEQQQQSVLVHRMREQLLKFITMQTNALRGMLRSFGLCCLLGPAYDRVKHYSTSAGANCLWRMHD